MYRMILVDDEPHIRKGLICLIPWEDYGIEIVGEAKNGDTAMKLIEELHPEIAIVDIRMPHTTGLELLERMKDQPNAPKFVMLSGFDQFSYVRDAMRMGAKNYLLKPVNAEELRTTIIELTNLLDDEKSKKQQFDESIQALMNNTLNRLLENRIEVRELREKCQLLGITLRCNQMVVGIVKPLFDNRDVSMRWVVFQSMDLCREQLNRSLCVYPVADAMDNVALIIKNPELTFNREQLNGLLQDCATEIETRLNIPCLTALGTEATSSKALPASYQNALRTVELKRLLGNPEIEADTVAAIQQEVNLSFDPETFFELLSNNRQQQLEHLVRHFFYKTLQKNGAGDRNLIKYHLIELVTSALHAAHKCYVPAAEIEEIRAESYGKIQAASSIHALEKCIQALMTRLCDCVQHMDHRGYSQRIQFVLEYVHQHYDDCNLSLKTLADKLSINPAYLGRMFSEETGVYFTEYLNEIRIHRAKELLDTTPMKLAEVAEQVGISNVSYFSTIYKRFTGERPGQSRKYRKGPSER